ncbi:MAG: deoxyuridine 5'-triphosphate nucleotidohydrolase [Candidatus Korarchaeota archaeon]|nr:deoxyuridine 5'-triphosphate nucleotidohydrolase [Candidatus Korarchaeota archaeon]NIU84244.1 deoxyuridine 5'-triphosphate nucleotidohydrolase [Candidatus Thorarchaeota archaeon]NIW14407.1 deoxyuridine 5'-triphosphate nucleotidohydrolase [Candidatus Thorarchaeota archaeon]NIW52476.1 deoxyuridine 5'-triphosphate nucleotidohydrolase [Candidatus Korarchaeota archaeon]
MKKAVWSGEKVAKFIKPLRAEQINPNGVDLRASTVLRNVERGILTHKRKIPKRVEVPSKKGVYHLRKGSYVVVYKEIVQIPDDTIGLVFPRSSLMRMGARLHSAVWDSGYRGRGEGLLVVHNDKGIHLKKGAKVGQMIFLSANASGQYQGIYQGERMGKGEEALLEER